MTLLRPFSPRYVRLRNGVEIEYVEHGPRGGETLLLLHGITDAWRSFEPLLPHLRGDWNVVAMSLRGHGGSDKSAGSYRIGDFATDAALLAEELALPPLTVVGHSLGSAVALRLAIDRPDLVRGLALAGAFASFADKPDLAAFVETAIAPLGDTVPRELAEGFQRDTIAGPVADGLLDTMVDECLRTPAAVWRAAFAALAEDRFGDQLDRVDVPVLLAWGNADAFTAEDDQRRLARGLRLAVRSIYHGTGHALHWEQPQRFAEDLARFVDRLGRAGFSAAALAA